MEAKRVQQVKDTATKAHRLIEVLLVHAQYLNGPSQEALMRDLKARGLIAGETLADLASIIRGEVL